MNIGEIYVSSGVRNTKQCGDVALNSTKLERQAGYKTRHKDDFSAKPFVIRMLDSFLPAIILCTICIILFKFVMLNGFIPSSSMEPTMNIGDGIIVNRLAYGDEDMPNRGDVIVFRSEEYNGQYLIKRVIGLPGDTIELKGGYCFVNGCKLVEDYVVGKTEISPNGRWCFEVPEGSVFLMGDNREHSADSRWWENPYVDKSDIMGKAVFQYSLPFSGNGGSAKVVEAIQPDFVCE